MKLIYAQGFSKNEKMEWKPVVFTNIIQSFRLIHDAMNDLGIAFENPDNEVSCVWRWLLAGFWPCADGLLNRKTWPKSWSTTK
jgi:hypothetical protein